MTEKTTIGALKERGAVGQVIAGNINRYVIVEETPSGVNVTRLYGPYGPAIGDPGEVFEVPDMQEIYVEDKEHWKESFAERWDEIAQRYPAIG